MQFRVEIAQTAEIELEQLYLWVVEQAPNQGTRWFNGLERAILGLGRHPERFRIAPESIDTLHPVRVLLYGRKPHVYRIFFTVEPQKRVVRVVHLRHGARRPPAEAELRGDI